MAKRPLNYLSYRGRHRYPVKHGYVKRVVDWEFSSFHRCLRQDLYPSELLGLEAGMGE
jgi:hypothetical protein